MCRARHRRTEVWRRRRHTAAGTGRRVFAVCRLGGLTWRWWGESPPYPCGAVAPPGGLSAPASRARGGANVARCGAGVALWRGEVIDERSTPDGVGLGTHRELSGTREPTRGQGPVLDAVEECLAVVVECDQRNGGNPCRRSPVTGGRSPVAGTGSQARSRGAIGERLTWVTCGDLEHALVTGGGVCVTCLRSRSGHAAPRPTCGPWNQVTSQQPGQEQPEGRAGRAGHLGIGDAFRRCRGVSSCRGGV